MSYLKPRITHAAKTLDAFTSHELGYPRGGNPPARSGSGAHLDPTKISQEEWDNNNAVVMNEAGKAKKFGIDVNEKSRAGEKEARERTQGIQDKSTQMLKDRADEIKHWMDKLENEIERKVDEFKRLQQCKNRLEDAMAASEIALFITSESLRLRDRRAQPDLVADTLEAALLTEANTITAAEELLARTIDEVIGQMGRIRDAKHSMEMDWSDKKIAWDLQTMNAALHDTSPDIMFYPGATGFSPDQITFDEWKRATQTNLNVAEKEDATSEELRRLVDKMCNDVADDMVKNHEKVMQELEKKITELNNIKDQLEQNLKELLDEIAQMEDNLDSLLRALGMWGLEGAMKKAQTRLHNMQYRPRTENCKDPVQSRLLDEVDIMVKSADQLQDLIEQAEDALKRLNTQRLELDSEITTKQHSLEIDRDKILPMRYRYPSWNQLAGYGKRYRNIPPRSTQNKPGAMRFITKDNPVTPAYAQKQPITAVNNDDYKPKNGTKTVRFAAGY